MSARLSILLALSLVACPAGKLGSAPEGGAARCADGTWSGWTSSDGLILVSATGDDRTADGSRGAPYATLAAALQASRGSGDVNIAIGPGSFLAGLTLVQGAGGRTMTVQGCSDSETTLYGERAPLRSVLAIGGTTPIALRRLRVTGPGGGVVVRAGADATLERLTLEQTQGFGVGVVGEGARAAITDVEILQPDGAPHRRMLGWGVVVAHGQATLTRVHVQGATGMGVFVGGGSLSASELVVADTSHTGKGRRGFGIYARDGASLSLADCVVQGASDAGVALIDVATASLTRCTINDVAEDSTGGGDGIVAIRQDAAATPTLTLDAVEVHRAARMGLALSGVQATVSGLVAGDDNGLSSAGSSIYGTADVSLSGASAAPLDRDEQRMLAAFAMRVPKHNAIP